MITVWHNPRCSKSRQTLALIQEAGVPVTLRKYLEDAPSLTELQEVQRALNIPVIDMLRPAEKRFKELGLSRSDDAATLLEAAAANPILIERPIALKGSNAVIGRPPEAVKALL